MTTGKSRFCNVGGNQMNLAIGIEENSNQYVVSVSGEIDVYTAPELIEKLLPLTEVNGNEIQIDLQNTTYLDSTGLGVFINAYKSTKEHQSHLELIHLKDRVLRLFKVTGLDEIMNIRPTKVDGREH
jgi:anti-sigma B factor antagonist